MWCERFDGDLYRLVPEARAIVAPVAGFPLVTNGRLTDGALNHPSVWNHELGMIAWFAETDQAPGWTGPGKVAPEVFWTHEPLVACTFEQAVRDCWVHHYAIVLVGTGSMNHAPTVIWNTSRMGWVLTDLLFHARGIRMMEPAAMEERRTIVTTSLAAAVARMKGAVGSGHGQRSEAGDQRSGLTSDF